MNTNETTGWRMQSTDWATGEVAWRGATYATRAEAERAMFNDTGRENARSWTVAETAN